MMRDGPGPLFATPPDRDRHCLLGAGSIASVLAVGSIASVASIGSIAGLGSVGSIASIGSVGSVGSTYRVGAVLNYPVAEKVAEAVGRRIEQRLRRHRSG